ncbi:MAG: hypothetical protein EDX89_07095 [Acidobacteria bacterium]|nr:MAG: hypothetical protein EDX89_07095 [Acidobacteriota bacterium]MCE7957158.1 hypothetical protein [Acidobacteria bacterium ACB2]
MSHYVLEDLDDRPASYAVLLARVGGDVPAVSAADVEARVTGGQESVLQLQRSIAEVRSAPGGNAGDRDAQLSKLAGQLAEARRALVGGEIFCTVFTGARSSMPVVRKCQKGLPAFLVEKAEAQARLREVSPSLLITRPLFLDPFSVTYEAAGESGPAGAIVFDLETRRTAQKAELQARRRAAEKQLAAAKSPADTQDLEALRAKNLRAWQRYLPRPGDTKVPIPPGSPAAQPARLGSETGGQK